MFRVLASVLLIATLPAAPSQAKAERIYLSSSNESSSNVKVSILSSDLQALVSNTKTCKKTLPFYIEPQPGAIARNFDINVYSSTYDQYDFVSNAIEQSQRLTFTFNECGGASWRALYWNISLKIAIQSAPRTVGDGIVITTSGVAEYKLGPKSFSANRGVPTLDNIEIVPSTKAANILASSKELLSDPPFTYEYKIINPSSQATSWKSARGPVIGVTKLKSKTKYKIGIRAVSFDKVYGKTLLKEFSTK